MAKNVQGATHIDRMDMLNLEARISLHEKSAQRGAAVFTKAGSAGEGIIPTVMHPCTNVNLQPGQLEATALLGKSDPEVAARVQGCLRTERLPPL